MDNLLVAENIVKKYADYTALDNVSIAVPKASIFGLLGPNGAGKTSLIRIINQITMPDSGKLFLNGEQMQLSDVKYIGYLPEERGLYKGMKVGEQALYLAQLKGISKYDAKRRLAYWFDRFEIKDWWGKKVQELSKGMAQKIQFIITVLHEPKLLIFDEPFSGFDPINANLIKEEILKLKENGSTIIFSTHRMESVEELCDYIALIDKSKKLLEGKLKDIKQENKSNTFEAILNQTDSNELISSFKEFQLISKEKLELENSLKLKISLNSNQQPNDLLQFLMTQGTVKSFKEQTPTVNEIFMKSINRNAVDV